MSYTCLFSCRDEKPAEKGKKKELKKSLKKIQEEPVHILSLSHLPQKLTEIQGQKRVVKQLQMLCTACLKEKKPLPHLLFCGSPGLGKTTIARLLANEMNATIEVISCSFIQSSSHLISILSRLGSGDILFLDEMHSMNRSCSESLYHAMDHFALELLVEKKKTSRSLVIPLNPFTLIGATTYPGKLCKPFLSRFEAVLSFEEYSIEELNGIVRSTSKKLGIILDRDAAEAISGRARGSPRIALHFLKWTRRFLLFSQKEVLTKAYVLEALELLGVDAIGLNPMERKILEIILIFYGGGPVGVHVLASHLGESSETIEEMYEPYLLREGLLIRSPRGRSLTKRGRDYVQSQQSISNLDHLNQI